MSQILTRGLCDTASEANDNPSVVTALENVVNGSGNLVKTDSPSRNPIEMSGTPWAGQTRPEGGSSLVINLGRIHAQEIHLTQDQGEDA